MDKLWGSKMHVWTNKVCQRLRFNNDFPNVSLQLGTGWNWLDVVPPGHTHTHTFYCGDELYWEKPEKTFYTLDSEHSYYGGSVL